MNDNLSGFRILNFRRLDNWKLLEVDANIPFRAEVGCPADGTALKTLCTLVGHAGKQQIRIGCCPSCGYVGYIDRPAKEWVDKFYADTWHIPVENDEEKIKKTRERFAAGKDRRVNAVSIVERLNLPIDRDRPVCEIGSGYGFTLKRMERQGFKILIGMESSLHRAEIARQALGLQVLSAPFEDPNTQNELARHAPFSLIFSHHVFEHVYNPNEIVSLCSGLQKEGDYIILTMPNLAGEFSLSTIFYFPHLNAFTKLSLKKLLDRHGYETINDSLTTDSELCLVAQKKGSRRPVESGKEDHFGAALAKFERYFGLNRAYGAPSLLWGFRDVDIAGRIPYLGRLFSKAAEAAAARFGPVFYRARINSALGFSRGGPKNILSMVIAPLEQRYTAYAESPLEIQFSGNIKLSFK